MIDRRLRVLRMVASCGTVSGAAEALHYTPSAVSQQLKTLAKDVGVDLVEHDARRLRLTPAGRILLERADELFSRWEEIRAEVVSESGDQLGTLRLCGFSTAAAALLPPVATAVSERHPGCRVSIIEAEPAECFDLLLADGADVAVVVATGDVPSSTDPRFELHFLREDPLDVIVPEHHPLAAVPQARLQDFADEQWVSDRPGRAYHQLLLTACAAAGFTPDIRHHAAEWDTGTALVAAGLGVGLIPRLARVPTGYPISRVVLTGDSPPTRHLLAGVSSGTARHPLVAAALEALGVPAAQP